MCSRAYDPSWSICCMALLLFEEFYSKQNCSQFTNVLSVRVCAPYNNYVCVRMCVCACLCLCLCVHMCVHMCVYVCMHVHTCVYVCMHAHVCVCMCVYLYVHICVICLSAYTVFKCLQLTNSSITIFSISVASSICCLTTLISLSGTSCLQKSNYINTCNKFISVIRESTNLSI